jgi:glycosyltransferase involved in cell wall biosynthesis
MTQTNLSPAPPLLSFAIPTYNRAKYLDQLLGVLLHQAHGESRVELIVSDNASTDNTQEVIEAYRQRGLDMRYLRNEANRGPDFNILQCYEQAIGKYVWVFGDDDLLLDGAIPYILTLLARENPDFVFLAPSIFHESTDEIKTTNRIVPTQVIDDLFLMVSLVNLHADPIFISAAITNKERVSSLGHPPFTSLLGTNLVNLGWVLTNLCHFRRGVFVQLGTLAARVGNSSGGYLAAEVFGRNYSRMLSDCLSQNPKLVSKLLQDHLRIWFPRNWLHFRSNGENGGGTYDVLKKAFRQLPSFWFCACPLICAPWNLARVWARLLRIPSDFKLRRLSVSARNALVH